MDEGGFHGEFQETMGNLEHSYKVPTDSPVSQRE